jgi:hypothetical protein
MAFYTQIFNLIKQGSNAYESKQELEHLQTYEGWEEFSANYKGKDVYGAYDKAISKGLKQYSNNLNKMTKSSVAAMISTSKFIYNYTASTTRFGLRGQDIQDQLKIQDKLVNKSFDIATSTAAGAMVGGAIGAVGALVLSVATFAINEAISVSIQNKSYEYRKAIDEQQKSIMQERIGRAVYNSSRRA